MVNRGDGLNLEQSNYAHYRTPSRKMEREYWYGIRAQILVFWTQGLSSKAMATKIKTQGHRNQYRRDQLTPQTVRSYFQRIYNELGIRSPSGALYEAIRRGLVACPCPGCQNEKGEETNELA
jgi:hypothetical protein